MKRLALIALAVLTSACWRAETAAQRTGVNMNESSFESFKTAEELRVAAMDLADSKNEASHTQLLSWLKSKDFLGRLDSMSEYQEPSRKLRLWAVLQRLRDNDVSSAHRVLTELTRDQNF